MGFVIPFLNRFNEFKDKPRLVIDSIEAVTARAHYQGLNDVIMITNAITNRYYSFNAGTFCSFQFLAFSI